MGMNIQPRTQQEEEKIQENITDNIEQLDRCELYRTFFVLQISKRNTLK